MATLAGRAYVSVEYDPVSIAKLRATTAAEGQRVAQSWSKVGNSFKTIGSSMTRHVTLPIIAAGAASVKFAVDFNTSLNHIQALVGANAKEMELYRRSILALSPAVGKGPKELADALYFITSSGLKGAAALKVLEVSAKASAAGLGTTQTVADLVTSAINAYGSANISAAKATDVLTAAVRLGKAEPQDFVTALGRVIPVAQAMGVSFGQLSGAVAALTISGQSTEVAATGIRQVLLNILKPSAGAATALHSVGLSVKELQDTVRNKGLLPALDLLNTKFHGNRAELSHVITNARSLTVALSLIGPNADKAARIISQVSRASGDTAKAFDTASKSAQFKFNQALAQLQVTAIKLGTVLIPILEQIASGVAVLAKDFDGLSKNQQKWVLIAVAGAAILGPLVGIIGTGITVVTGLAAAFTALAAGELLAAGPILLIIAGVAAIAIGFVIAYKRSATFRTIVHDALIVAAAAAAFAGREIGLIAGIIQTVTRHFGTFKSVGVSAFRLVASAVGGMISVAKSVYGVVQGIVGAIHSLYDAAKSVITLGGALGPGGGNPLPHVQGGRGGVRPATGGIITGGTPGVDSVPALLTPGEVVLNKDQQLRLLNGGAAGDTYVNVIIDGKAIESSYYKVQRRTARRLQAGVA